MTQHRFKVGDQITSYITDHKRVYVVEELTFERENLTIKLTTHGAINFPEDFFEPLPPIPPDPLVTDLVSDYLVAQEGG